LLLPFLPMLPPQVLLNNLLYDVSEVGVPFDNVDEVALKRPVHWNIGFIKRFMLVLGPVSSLFDFLTFFALLSLFGAGQAIFQSGWFIESLTTQCLVIFIIRTRGVPWRSKPHPALTGLTLGAVAVGLLLPLTPPGKLLGFVEPPPGFYVFLVCAVAAYLLLVEIVKRQLYRRLDVRSGRAPVRPRGHKRWAPGQVA
jgi:P-type Mg2+ transporter